MKFYLKVFLFISKYFHKKEFIIGAKSIEFYLKNTFYLSKN